MLRTALLIVTVLASAHTANAGSPVTSAAINDPALQWGPCPEFLPTGCAIAVLHGDPAQPNVDVFFKVPGGAKIPRHRHTSAERMVLVSGELTVTYDGLPPTKLVTGMYAYGPAGHAHEAVCAEGVDCVLFIAFEAPLDAVAVK
jgi:quercetin dioxygenase-like cupin family protein